MKRIPILESWVVDQGSVALGCTPYPRRRTINTSVAIYTQVSQRSIPSGKFSADEPGIAVQTRQASVKFAKGGSNTKMANFEQEKCRLRQSTPYRCPVRGYACLAPRTPANSSCVLPVGARMKSETPLHSRETSRELVEENRGVECEMRVREA